MTLADTLAAIPRTSYDANALMGTATMRTLGCSTALVRNLDRASISLRYGTSTLVEYEADGTLTIMAGPRRRVYTHLTRATAQRIRCVLPPGWTLERRAYTYSHLVYGVRPRAYDYMWDSPVKFVSDGIVGSYGLVAYEVIESNLNYAEEEARTAPRRSRREVARRRPTTSPLAELIDAAEFPAPAAPVYAAEDIATWVFGQAPATPLREDEFPGVADNVRIHLAECESCRSGYRDGSLTMALGLGQEA